MPVPSPIARRRRMKEEWRVSEISDFVWEVFLLLFYCSSLY
jgi:hypothetical protein